MKNNILKRAMLILISLVFLFCAGCSSKTSTTTKKSTAKKTEKTDNTEKKQDDIKLDEFVKRNGNLRVSGGKLCNEKGDAIQLKGMSSHGIQWFPQFVNKDSMQYLRDNWGMTVFRVAMYTNEGDGYIKNPDANKAKVVQAVNDAKSLGIYVIIDWHILSDNDPNTFKEQSKAFFKDMSSEFKDCPNVIYEICNEPNGGNVKWSTSIKPYAQEVIPVIRANSPKSIVIVGTGTWSQDVTDAAASPLSFDNVMYTCHFYAGTHKQDLRDKVSAALNKGIAIFVTEWGTSEASGNGGPFADETQKWMYFLESNKISWCNWSLSDKNETSAALKSGANPKGGWTDNDLSPSGKIVKAAMYKGSDAEKNAQNKSSTQKSSTQSKDSSSKSSKSSVNSSSGLKVEMFNGGTEAQSNSIYPKFKLINSGSDSIDLSKVTIRYYYTCDGAGDQNFFCDWSSAGNSNITGKFNKMSSSKQNADCYLEIGFSSGAGKLDAGKDIEVQTRFAKSDWSNYDQSNDYSFDSSDKDYAYFDKISAYISGSMVYGSEP